MRKYGLSVKAALLCTLLFVCFFTLSSSEYQLQSFWRNSTWSPALIYRSRGMRAIQLAIRAE